MFLIDFGVQDVNDHRFQFTFENVFNGEHLIKTPWFNEFGKINNFYKMKCFY